MKQLIWLSPCPGVGYKAVILKRFLGLDKILWRDLNGKCYSMWGRGGERIYVRDRKLGY